MTFAELIDKFLPQFLVLLIGLGLVFLVRREPEDGSGLPDTRVPLAYFSKKYVNLLRLGGLMLLVGAVIWIGISWSRPVGHPSAASPYAHLTSVGFMLDDWGPSQMDLRTAPTVGILVHETSALRFFDIQVSAPDTLDDLYKVQAEVYANDSEAIGRTDMVLLSPLVTDLGGVVPVSYQHPSVKESWAAQADWKELTILVSLYDKGGSNLIGSEKTHVRLTEATNKSWWITPPYAKFVSIVYQVNAGPSISMDLRTIQADGINIKGGDHLSIREMWYHSLENDDTKQIFAYVYFDPGPPEKMWVAHTQPMNIQSGIHNLVQDNSLQWDIDPTQTAVTFDLYRSEGHETEILARSVFLDRYVIPLKPGSGNGLFPLPSP